MRREPVRAFAILGLVAGLAVPAIAGNRQQPASAKPAEAKPAPVRPAPAHPAEATARPIAARPTEVAAKPAPAEVAAKPAPVEATAKPAFEQPPAPAAARPVQGGDAKPPPVPPDRVQKEREAQKAKEAQEKEKERIEKAREQEKAKGAAPAKPAEPARNAAAPGNAAEQREVAKKAAHFEQRYRSVQARIDRLIRIYKAKGDTAKVAKLEQMKAREEKRKANAMEGFRKQMSSENWGKLNSEMEKQHGRIEHGKGVPPGERPKETTPPKSGG